MQRVFFILLFLGLVGCAPDGAAPQPEAATEPGEVFIPVEEADAPEASADAVETEATPEQTHSAGSSPADAGEASDLYPIQLQSRTFVPEPGVETAVRTLQQNTPESQSLHLLIQFADIPDDAERQSLENAGVILLDYVPQNSWFVSVPAALDLQSDPLANAVYVGAIQPADRLDPTLSELLDAATQDPIALEVRFFSDVPPDAAKTQLINQGAVILASVPDFYRFTVQIPQDKVATIASLNDVQWITNAAPPKTTDGE